MVPIQRYSRTVAVCLENGVSQMHSVALRFSNRKPGLERRRGDPDQTTGIRKG
jgi:hypothetical protein